MAANDRGQDITGHFQLVYPTEYIKAPDLREKLSAEAVDANAHTYLQQLGQGQDPSRALLDFETPGRLEVRRNSEWLAGLDKQ